MPQRSLQIIHSYIPIGLALWLVAWFIPNYSNTERIILFAALVVVPLTVFRVLLSSGRLSEHIRFINLLIYLLPIGAVSLIVSLASSSGVVAGLLSFPWTLVTFIIAWKGLFFARNAQNLASISTAIGFIYISIGGIWLIAHQFNTALLGFHGEMMLLTVNHFHYAGFVVPILYGYLYSYVANLLTKIGLLFATIAPILIALGMTYFPLIEWISVLVFAASLLLYSSLIFIFVISKTTRWTKVLHILSSGIIWVTMALALLYGYGQWTSQVFISIPTMIIFHGYGNAIVLCFLGMLAWHATRMDQETEKIPFSNIQGKGKIGSAFFYEQQAVESSTEKLPTGLIDNMQDYKSEHLNPRQLHTDIIDFYEHTEDYELLLSPHWSKAFAIPAKIYKWISNRIEQMNFPLQAESIEQQVESNILPIHDNLDGRKNVRAWVRTYTDTKKAIYAALYSTHVSNNTRYMNIAFPLPFSQMTSVLFLEQLENNSLSLSSWQTNEGQDQGVYLVFNKKAIRLPINETITVWKDPKAPKGRVEAKHDMWLFGMKFLSLDYHITSIKD